MRVVVLIVTVLCCVQSKAETQVERYFADLNNLSAQFIQTVTDDQGQISQHARGRMYMQKPGRFRWEYSEPYEQLIIADGEFFWLYDKDLQQVTVRRVEDALTTTPLALLGDETPIADAFTISSEVDGSDLLWFTLTPKSNTSDVQSLRVAFSEQQLVMIELSDSLRQTTRLGLRNVRLNTELASGLFKFVPPAGVDVVGDGND